MNCPVCNGEMWNNIPKKKSGEFKASAPDYKCKDKSCEGVIWPEKESKGSGAKQNGGGAVNGNGGGIPASSSALAPLYNECVSTAKAVLEHNGVKALPADVVAAAATLFIAATRDGRPVKSAPKAKAPAKQPVRQTVPADNFEEFPGALEDTEDRLPF
jgi:hypothetical protein